MSGQIMQEKSWLKWTLLSILTMGICGYIYMYYNLEDLNKLYARAGRGEALNVGMMFLFYFLIPFVGPIIVIYTKYQKMNEYVIANRGTNNVPSGMGMVLWILLLGWTVVVPLYFEWKWQDVMNQQIRNQR